MMTTVNSSCASTGATPSVADLLRQIGEGDPVAWDEIVHRYGELVRVTVRSFRLQDADALDAAQTTWLHLTEHAHRIRHPERLGGWLVTTARRACLQILRQAKPSADRFDVAADTVADPSAGPEQRVIDADSTRRLWNFVGELSPCRQTLLRALFTEHPRRSYAEVSRIAGIPGGGIGPTRARALRQLRGRLEQYGLEPGAW